MKSDVQARKRARVATHPRGRSSERDEKCRRPSAGRAGRSRNSRWSSHPIPRECRDGDSRTCNPPINQFNSFCCIIHNKKWYIHCCKSKILLSPSETLRLFSNRKKSRVKEKSWNAIKCFITSLHQFIQTLVMTVSVFTWLQQKVSCKSHNG